MKTYNPFTITHSAIAFIGRFLATQWSQFNPLGQMLFALALAAIVIDAAVSFQYGLSMTKWHAAGFAVVAIAFCVLPDVAVTEARKGNWAGSIIVGIAAALLGLVALQSHIGYGGGIRMKEIQQTQFQHAKATDVRKVASSEEKNLETLRSLLASKIKERDDLKEAASWAATTHPDALKAEISNLEGDFIFKRSKSCANVTLPESRAFCDKHAAAKVRLGQINKANELAEQIASTQADVKKLQAVVDAKVKTVADTGFESNVVLNQTDIITSLINFARGVEAEDAINPTSVQRTVANTAVVGFNSIGFLICGPILMIAAGFNRLRKFVFEDEDTLSASVPSVPTYQPVVHQPLAKPTPRDAIVSRDTTGYVIVNDDEARRLKEAIRNAIAPRRLSAA